TAFAPTGAVAEETGGTADVRTARPVWEEESAAGTGEPGGGPVLEGDLLRDTASASVANGSDTLETRPADGVTGGFTLSSPACRRRRCSALSGAISFDCTTRMRSSRYSVTIYCVG